MKSYLHCLQGCGLPVATSKRSLEAPTEAGAETGDRLRWRGYYFAILNAYFEILRSAQNDNCFSLSFWGTQ